MASELHCIRIHATGSPIGFRSRIGTRLDHAVRSRPDVGLRGNCGARQQSEKFGAKAVTTSRGNGMEAQKGSHCAISRSQKGRLSRYRIVTRKRGESTPLLLLKPELPQPRRSSYSRRLRAALSREKSIRRTFSPTEVMSGLGGSAAHSANGLATGLLISRSAASTISSAEISRGEPHA